MIHVYSIFRLLEWSNKNWIAVHSNVSKCIKGLLSDEIKKK